MTGSQTLRRRGGWFVAGLALSFFTFAGHAPAQYPSPPLPPSGMSAQSSVGLVEAVSPQQTTAGPMTGAQPTYCPDLCVTPTAPRVELGLCDTIIESLCGEGKWRPLTLATFFSEGWNEAWAGGPAGQSGLTPRHGWLGSFEGLFYRLWLVNGTYQYNLNKPFGGEGYGSNFTTFLPFSRRFELFFNAPFIVANGTEDPTRVPVGLRRPAGCRVVPALGDGGFHTVVHPRRNPADG